MLVTSGDICAALQRETSSCPTTSSSH